MPRTPSEVVFFPLREARNLIYKGKANPQDRKARDLQPDSYQRPSLACLNLFTMEPEPGPVQGRHKH
jgi:hypothetical protein